VVTVDDERVAGDRERERERKKVARIGFVVASCRSVKTILRERGVEVEESLRSGSRDKCGRASSLFESCSIRREIIPGMGEGLDRGRYRNRT
jgi:hypothetical protein